MPRYLGAFIILFVIAMVLTRVYLLKKRGVTAMKFGTIDKTDFAIPPFALFYIYLIFAGAFRWPTFARTEFFNSTWVSYLGVLCCAAALVFMYCSLVSFGASFRIGIDTDQPDKLVTSGVFAITRNPIYVAFGLILLGEFLIQPNWITLAYALGGVALFHRQVLREEAYLEQHYGDAYCTYRKRVRRYL